ncbi:MAG: IS110 family transposase [Anaerolineae bacterium]|jgi:transposase
MLFCGIDIAKRQHAIALLDGKGQLVQPILSIPNDRAGFDQLIQALPDPDAVAVGLEATGHYWVALYDALTRQGFSVVVLNPLQVAAYRRSGVRKVKSDRSDAVWIADFLRIANPSPTRQDLPVLLQLRELSRFRFRLTDQIGDIKRKLLTILDRVFPEYEQLFSSVFLRTSRALLEQAVSAQEVAEMDLQELAALLQEASRGRFGREKAQQIQAHARRSVGVGFLADAAQIEMRCLLAQIELLEQQRDQIDDALAILMDQIPQHLTSIPGIGPVTGAAIVAEIGDVSRFDSVEKLVAYAGIDPSVYQTGQFRASEAHMSKRGSPYLRHALWLAASVAIKHDPQLQAYYQRKRQEGKHYGTALGAVCRKLLARVYIVLKEQRPYVVKPPC